MASEDHWLEIQYNRYGADVLRYLERRFSPTLCAEDLLQETFIESMKNANRAQDIVSPLAWLLGIARNVGLMAMRRQHAALPLPDDLCDKKFQTPDCRLDDMRQALAELPESHREILELRLTHELSYEELATVLNIPVGTVRSRLHHAVRQLKEKMTGGKSCR